MMRGGQILGGRKGKAPESAASGACFTNVTGDDIRINILTAANYPATAWLPQVKILQQVLDHNNLTSLSGSISQADTNFQFLEPRNRLPRLVI
jgi:hypothetical protein